MKTLFICAESRIDAHIGECYDSIYEVPDAPTIETIGFHAKEIRSVIVELWKTDVSDNERDGDPFLKVILDGSAPFNAMLRDYQIVLRDVENVVMELNYPESADPTTIDEETLDLLSRLEKNDKERKAANAKI